MSNLIIDTTLAYWYRQKTKNNSAGWATGNAVCCYHRGETQDHRGRAGVIMSGNTISYNCFNCHFKTGYTEGGPLGFKFQKLLTWLGVDDHLLATLRLESLKIAREINPSGDAFKPVEPLQEIALPDQSVLLSDHAKQFPAHVAYLQDRGFGVKDYAFYVNSNPKDRAYRRIILPFVRDGVLVGNTARAIDSTTIPKYLRSTHSPYVFGADLQRRSWNWTIVVEGEFDALSVDGLGIGGNEISDGQAEIIRRLGIKPIIVGDSDAGGIRLIRESLDWGWAVSFPQWEPRIKDLNQAVLKYGKLAVVKHIWDQAVYNPITIKIKLKLLQQAQINTQNDT